MLAFMPVLLRGPAAVGQTGRGEAARDLVVGKAGSRFITEEEFVRRFELTPGLYRHRAGRLDEEKTIVMFSLIAEKLLAQEAEAQGADSAAAGGLEYLAGLLARDALYRQEIIGKVEVSTEELRQGVRDARRHLLVLYLFFPDEQDAQFVAGQTRGKDLRTFAVDSSIQALRDTVTILWGSAEPAVEQAAYALQPGEISPVVRSSKGYLILQLLAETPNSAVTGMIPAVQREHVTSAIRLRKEERRLEEFTQSFFAGKTGYAIPSKLKAVAGALYAELIPVAGDSLFELGPGGEEGLRRRLGPVLSDTFMVAGRKAWTTAEVIRKIVADRFRVQSKLPGAVAGSLEGRCRVWVLQELLTQEALRRGLDRSPEVQAQLKEWRESYLAQLMRARVESGVMVSDADVLRFREMNGNPLPVPQVRVRELKTASVEEMRLAMTALEGGMAFDEAVRHYTIDPAARSTGGLTEFFPITARPPVGEIAARLSPGQMYGPVPVAGGLLLFQLAEKSASPAADSSAAAQRKAAAEELLRLTRKQALDRFIAQAARKRGIAVYQDRLKALQVTPLPMTAFRVMGFGGRMFAAPLMPRLFDWVSTPVPEPVMAP